MERKVTKKEYMERIDHETRIVLDQITSISSAIDQKNISELRELNTQVCNALKSGRHPQKIRVENKIVELKNREIRIRTYKANRVSHAQILYVHGGGFIMGDIETDDDICADICVSSGITVTAVEYRLSPEFKHPAALEDVRACFNYLKTKEPIILVGYSAGATLVAVIASELRRSEKSLLGQVLICPFLGGNLKTGSYVEHANSPWLTTNEMMFYLSHWLKKGHNLSFLPLNEKSFKNLPPTAVFTADLDPLRDDGFNYVSHLKSQKVEVFHANGDGLLHGFLRARHRSVRAMQMYQKLVEQIKCLGNKPVDASRQKSI